MLSVKLICLDKMIYLHIYISPEDMFYLVLWYDSQAF